MRTFKLLFGDLGAAAGLVQVVSNASGCGGSANLKDTLGHVYSAGDLINLVEKKYWIGWRGRRSLNEFMSGRSRSRTCAEQIAWLASYVI